MSAGVGACSGVGADADAGDKGFHSSSAKTPKARKAYPCGEPYCSMPKDAGRFVTFLDTQDVTKGTGRFVTFLDTQQRRLHGGSHCNTSQRRLRAATLLMVANAKII